MTLIEVNMTMFTSIIHIFSFSATRTFTFHYPSTIWTFKPLEESINSISNISSLISFLLSLTFFPFGTRYNRFYNIHINYWFQIFLFANSFILFIITHIDFIIYNLLNSSISPFLFRINIIFFKVISNLLKTFTF